MREKDLKKANSVLPGKKRPPRPKSGMSKAVKAIKDHDRKVSPSSPN